MLIFCTSEDGGRASSASGIMRAAHSDLNWLDLSKKSQKQLLLARQKGSLKNRVRETDSSISSFDQELQVKYFRRHITKELGLAPAKAN